MPVEEMVDRCGALSRQKAAIEKEMKDLRLEIIRAAQYPTGSKTARIIGRRFVAKIEKKEEIKYDKTSLKKAMNEIGEDEFKTFFDWEFIPKAKKPEIDAYIKLSPHGGLIAEARKVREMSPSVSFTENEEV
jgi:hypothetical protein